MDALKWLLSWFWPPTHPDPQQNRWQQAMSMGFLGVVAMGLIATNQIPGVEGFAHKSDVSQLQATAVGIEARIIAQDIYEARKEQCRAIAERDGAAKPGPLRRINTLLVDYQRITGQPYRLPGCEEI